MPNAECRMPNVNVHVNGRASAPFPPLPRQQVGLFDERRGESHAFALPAAQLPHLPVHKLGAPQLVQRRLRLALGYVHWRIL